MNAPAKDPFNGEKRVARKRTRVPASLATRLGRALSQRMYLIEREDRTDESGRISGSFTVLGSTGNVYTVVIGQVGVAT